MKTIIIRLLTISCAIITINAMEKTVSQSPGLDQSTDQQIMNIFTMRTVVIIDSNSNEKLEDYLDPVALPSVFGGTPRYSYFLQFKKTLKSHLHELHLAPKAGVNKKIKKGLQALAKSYKGDPADLFEQLTLEQQYEIFFTLGLDQKLLQENVALLTDLADSIPSTLKLIAPSGTLIHVLLPCYFGDCAALFHTKLLTIDMIHRFLQSAARFYKTLYEKRQTSQKILILIPPMSHFQNMMTCCNETAVISEIKEKSIVEVLISEITSKQTSQMPLILINQRAEELESLIKKLITAGINPKKIGSALLTIQAGLSNTTIFNPYVLRMDKEYKDFKNSLLITSTLFPLLKRGEQ